MKKEYPTNLTDNQWQILQKILEPSTRKRKYSLRDIMNCILYVNKTSQHVDKERGIDGNKKIKGRKEQLLTDTLGLPLGIYVHEANIHDRKGAEPAFEKIAHKFPRLKKILADGGYRGEELKELVHKTLGCNLEVVLRPEQSPKKFHVIPLRWIVERSFAWLYNFRRIAMDYEFYSESSEAMIQIAFSKIMLNKLSN